MEVGTSGQVVHQASTTFLNGTKIARSGSLLMKDLSLIKTMRFRSQIAHAYLMKFFSAFLFILHFQIEERDIREVEKYSIFVINTCYISERYFLEAVLRAYQSKNLLPWKVPSDEPLSDGNSTPTCASSRPGTGPTYLTRP